jgi:hypothetical protein
MSVSSIPFPLHERAGSGGLVWAPAGAWVAGRRAGAGAPGRSPGRLVAVAGLIGLVEGLLSQYAAEADQVRARLNYTYILLIRRYRVTSGTTLPAMMAPSPTAAATSNRIFICQVSLLSPSLG